MLSHSKRVHFCAMVTHFFLAKPDSILSGQVLFVNNPVGRTETTKITVEKVSKLVMKKNDLAHKCNQKPGIPGQR